ncbi:hypothetical protein K503DRAFT_337818 [Rhizopogon vinicolor AM-OR11-026]|uniref:F-box domain-containing protein n=1 Tax=Rhizopogon vinicolor AM-OR11-026 TaxID=1314800 RepID=A0A1B7MTM0_9AGAM|nr:hypothetical protein K503DRAFT_337818 [Rhizopogon vinicolor AM-OR11-026]
MRALRSRRNSLACISCLPSEILATIFEHVVESRGSKGACRHPPCLTITYVCTHWRRLALESPSLWATIDQNPSRWMDIMLERSKKVALVVTCNASTIQRDCLNLHRYYKFSHSRSSGSPRAKGSGPYQVPYFKDKHPYFGALNFRVVASARHVFSAGFELYMCKEYVIHLPVLHRSSCKL